MMSKYRLKAPIRGVLHKPGGGLTTVTLPAGAVVNLVPSRSSTHLGTIDVLWKGRNYSIAEKDLQQKADCIPGSAQSFHNQPLR